MSPGMLSVAAMHVVYNRGRVAGHELLHNDWCQAVELLSVLDPLLLRAVELSKTMPVGRFGTA